MTKKVLAVLLAVLMLLGLMAGCTRTREVWVSYSDDEGTGVANSDQDDQQDNDQDGDTNADDGSDGQDADGDNDGKDADGNNDNDADQDGNDKNPSNTKRQKTTTGKVVTTTPGRTRGTKAKADALTFTPVADAGADYDVKGTVSIAVDTVRPTDYDAMFDVLVELYPNIDFEFDYWTHDDHDDGREYLTKTMATKSAANIMWDEAGAIPTYIINGGWIKPITKYVAKDPEAKYIPANLKEDYTYYGELFAVPHQATFETVAINTKLYSELGLTNKDMPGLEWSMDEYEALLKKGAAGWNAGKCVAIGDLFESHYRVAFYNGAKTSTEYGRHSYNYSTGQYDVKFFQEGCRQFRQWREIPGVEGWFMRESTQSQLGISGYATLWADGKALLEDTLTAYTENWDEQYPNLQWKQWTIPNIDGNLMMHVDHCFITSTTPEADMDACYQALRFMTFTTNGNLARLTMYEDSQKGKYNLNSHIYYPTTTSKTVIEKFNKLSCTDEVDEYMVANIPNSSRYDTFKIVPGVLDANAYWTKAVHNVTDGLDDGSGLVEPANKANATLKEYKDALKKAFDKYYK